MEETHLLMRALMRKMGNGRLTMRYMKKKKGVEEEEEDGGDGKEENGDEG